MWERVAPDSLSLGTSSCALDQIQSAKSVACHNARGGQAWLKTVDSQVLFHILLQS